MWPTYFAAAISAHPILLFV